MSEEAVRLSWNIAAQASPKGMHDLVTAWGTDFRNDLKRSELPALIVHGDSDRSCRFDVSGKRTHEMLKGSKLVVLKDARARFIWTHADE
jgi:pimeloyl-ACP methyl ester carboxylesterase